jgi:NodT family efflux transporter outer membrane factor (OMF) lipoprotein
MNGRILVHGPAFRGRRATRRRHLRLLAATTALALVAGCVVGPDYKRPPVMTPAAFKEDKGWKPSHPRTVSRDDWWSIYDDPVLDRLEREVIVSNQNLKAAEAAYRQAQAIVQEARSQYFPTVGATGSGTRSGQGISSRGGGSAGRIVENEFSTAADVTWVPDIWGKVRRTVESDVATAQASAADIAAAQLSAQATLAIDYFQMRADEELQRLYEATVKGYQRSLDITRNKYNAGTAAKTDVMTAQALVETTQALGIAVGVQRAQLEHAIAILAGQPPSDFSIAAASFTKDVPVVPSGVPSELLERRPDIAAAERQMASANALVGVAVSAYYPSITLSASYGFASTAVSSLFNASNSVWSFGSSAAETIFDAGLRAAQVAAARAAYDQAVATYRQTVLTDFGQVEDELAALRIYEQQAAAEVVAVRDAEEALRLTINQYRAGTVDFTSVVSAEAIAFGDEQTVVSVQQNRLVASVSLIESLGGSWTVTQLPDEEQVKNDVKPADAEDPPAKTPLDRLRELFN